MGLPSSSVLGTPSRSWPEDSRGAVKTTGPHLGASGWMIKVEMPSVRVESSPESEKNTPAGSVQAKQDKAGGGLGAEALGESSMKSSPELELSPTFLTREPEAGAAADRQAAWELGCGPGEREAWTPQSRSSVSEGWSQPRGQHGALTGSDYPRRANPVTGEVLGSGPPSQE